MWWVLDAPSEGLLHRSFWWIDFLIDWVLDVLRPWCRWALDVISPWVLSLSGSPYEKRGSLEEVFAFILSSCVRVGGSVDRALFSQFSEHLMILFSISFSIPFVHVIFGLAPGCVGSVRLSSIRDCFKPHWNEVANDFCFYCLRWRRLIQPEKWRGETSRGQHNAIYIIYISVFETSAV